MSKVLILLSLTIIFGATVFLSKKSPVGNQAENPVPTVTPGTALGLSTTNRPSPTMKKYYFYEKGISFFHSPEAKIEKGTSSVSLTKDKIQIDLSVHDLVDPATINTIAEKDIEDIFIQFPNTKITESIAPIAISSSTAITFTLSFEGNEKVYYYIQKGQKYIRVVNSTGHNDLDALNESDQTIFSIGFLD